MSKAAIQRQMLIQHRAQVSKLSGGKLNATDVRPGLLRIVAPLKNNVPVLKFNPADTNSVSKAIERLLPKSNLFYANFMGFALLKAKTVNSISRPGNAAAVSFPDPRIFTGVGVGSPAGVTESESLEAIYNGTLSIQTDQDVRLQKFHMSNFRLVPQTQQGTTTVPNIWGVPTIDLSTSLLIWGDRRNEISVDLSSDSDLTNLEGAAGATNYGIILLEGFEVENAANNSRITDYFASLSGR